MLAPQSLGSGQAKCFILDENQRGIAGLLGQLFPGGTKDEYAEPFGGKRVFYFRLSEDVLQKARGLVGNLSNRPGPALFPHFPSDLPEGPYRGVFKGCLFIPQKGDYRFDLKSPGMVSMILGKHPVLTGKITPLIKGFYPVQIRIEIGKGKPDLAIYMTRSGGEPILLNDDCLTPLSLERGLKGSFYPSPDGTGNPVAEQWDPLVDYSNVNDFLTMSLAQSAVWKAGLQIPEEGRYRFITLTDDRASLLLDQKTVIAPGYNSSQPVYLKKGNHGLELRYLRIHDWGARIILEWIKPRSSTAEVIPNDAFGEIQ